MLQLRPAVHHPVVAWTWNSNSIGFEKFLTTKFGPVEILWHSVISFRHISAPVWLSSASSRIPQRMSTIWIQTRINYSSSFKFFVKCRNILSGVLCKALFQLVQVWSVRSTQNHINRKTKCFGSYMLCCNLQSTFWIFWTNHVKCTYLKVISQFMTEVLQFWIRFHHQFIPLVSSVWKNVTQALWMRLF